MPALRLAPNKEWKGNYRGKYDGNLYQTLNIDLERSPGRIALSNKMRRFSTTGIAYKFLLSDASQTTQWWAIGAGKMMKSANVNPVSAYSNDAIANTPTSAFMDMIIHEAANGYDRLVVSGATTLTMLNNGAWTTSWLSLTLAGTVGWHPMAKLQRLLAVGDIATVASTIRAVVHTIDQNDVVSNSRLILPPTFSINVIITTSDRFWFGLVQDRGVGASTSRGRTMIIEWDGTSLTYNREYLLTGVSVLTGFVVDDIPYFITDWGYIYKYSGGGFVKVQEFPLREDFLRFDPRSRTSGQESGIDPYGAAIDGELVYINIGAPIRTNVGGTDLTGGSRRMRSGVWIFNTKTLNLYHHMGLGEHATQGTDVNYASSPFDQPGGILKTEGTNLVPVLIASATVLTGGATWRTSSQVGIYYEEYSQNQSSNIGRNRGYIITSYIPISEIEALWQGLWLKFKRFVSSSNSIIVRWRVADPLKDADGLDESPLQAQGTWVNTTSFTCAVPTGVAVGHMVEIMGNDNGGCCFKISALSATPDGSSTITVTISEAAPTSSTDTFLARFDNWTSEAAITSISIGNQFVPFTSRADGEFIQLMVELRGFSVEIDDLIPIYKNNNLIESR